ncbi:BEN domain-containing protein 5-like isoform X1 [Zophobas morio]|uniref:BEN domain-containing protein 5-like isoform X1 n=2 Tax=Zophobas morio TaxID=2755281 RepID=UPI0030835D7E
MPSNLQPRSFDARVYLHIIVRMFACVKFVEDGSTDIVHLDEIQKSDDDYDDDGIYESSKTYEVKHKDGCYYKAHVLSVAASPEEATKLAMSKRLRLVSRCLVVENKCNTNDHSDSHNQNLKLKETERHNRNADENIMSLDSAYHTFTLMKRIVEEKEKKIKELEIENKELCRLNTELQLKVIGKFQALDEVLTNINVMNGKTHGEHTDRKAAIAERRGGNVHVGKGIWLPQIMFDNIYRKKKDTIFIKELAVALFGEDVLKRSSLFGGSANRTREAGRPALDAKKLLAMKVFMNCICAIDILRYRLQEKGVGKVQEEFVVKSMKKILNEKIQDLRRGPRKNKTKKPNEAKESMAEDTDEPSLGTIRIKTEQITNGSVQEVKDEDPLLSD